MKRKIAIVALLVMSLVASAQTTLNGVTEEYNGRAKHTPLGMVELRVRDASSAVSNEKGHFTLTFNTSKPGDKVVVRNIDRDIFKAGYEVFNKDALEQWYLSNSKDVFTIVLCKSSVFRELKDKWNKVSSESYARQYSKDQLEYKRQLDEGKMQIEEYQRKMLELEDKYYEQLGNLDNYIDRFARIDLSILSEKDSLLVAMLEQGKIDEVIKIYEEQKNVEKYLNAKSENHELEEANKKIEKRMEENRKLMAMAKEKIKQQVQAYYMVGGSESIMKIDSIYRELATRDSLDFDAAYAYAVFLNDQKRNSQAIAWGKRALTYPALTKIDRIKLYDLLSMANIHGDSPQEGLRYAQMTIDSLSRYIGTDSLMYVEWCLSAMQHAATALNMTGQNDKAEAMYERIISLCEKIIQKSGEYNGYNAIMDLNIKTKMNFISFLAYYNSKYEKALSLTDNFLQDAERYSKMYDVEILQLNFATAQRTVGDLYARLGMLEKSDSILKLSVANFRKLYDKNKEKYASDLSGGMLNLGITQYYALKYQESKATLTEAVAISRQNCNMDNNQDLEVLTLGLNNVGYILFVLQDLANSENYLEEATQHSERLITKSYDMFSMTYAISYINLFTVYLAEEKLDKCDAIIEKTTKTADYVYTKRGASYQMSYIILKKELAKYYIKKNEIAKAKAEIDQALKIEPTCLDAEPELVELLKSKGITK